MLPGSIEAWGEVRRSLGSPEQLVRVDRAELTEGPAAGAPVLVVRNPAGISFEVLLDRALDIGWADAQGMPLAWASSAGRVASTRQETAGSGWTRGFGGGLLTTCGLSSTGAPSVVDGVEHGLHGRVGHLPAAHVDWRMRGAGADAVVEITGCVVESALGEPSLQLERTIRAAVAHPSIEIADTVTNIGFTDAGHMFRHHLNLGYPLVREGTAIDTDAELFGERGSAPVPTWGDVNMVVADEASAERVLYARSGPSASFALAHAETRTALTVEWSSPTFPFLIVWRDASPGVNVLGIEPSTSRDDGRPAAERDGELVTMRPGEERSYRTVIRMTRDASFRDVRTRVPPLDDPRPRSAP